MVWTGIEANVLNDIDCDLKKVSLPPYPPPVCVCVCVCVCLDATENNNRRVDRETDGVTLFAFWRINYYL